MPEPVAPTRITRPRFVITMSFRISGRPRSSIRGIVVLIVRSTSPTRPCCTNAFTRKRPMPGGLMAKLHSLLRSNSEAWRSFMMARASSWVWMAVRLWLDTGVMLPSSLKAGGKPAVRNRSDAFLPTIARSRS